MINRALFISALMLVLAGCTKSAPTTIVPVDPISRFVAGFTNIVFASMVYSSTGVNSSASPQAALTELAKSGLGMPRITNFNVVEVRALHPQEPLAARLLTNSVAVLVDSEVGQRIILLKPLPGEWGYHVYEPR
jgi:hypothetical protein